MIPLLFLVAVVILIGIAFTRLGELFYISVRDGKLLVVRGRVPVSLLQELREICNKPRVKRGSIVGMRTDGGGQLYCRGAIDEGREQRMRNTFMLYPASKLRLAPLPINRSFGQIIGFVWLAWLFNRSS